jgi:hypothetical protein
VDVINKNLYKKSNFRELGIKPNILKGRHLCEAEVNQLGIVVICNLHEIKQKEAHND